MARPAELGGRERWLLPSTPQDGVGMIEVVALLCVGDMVYV